MNKPKFTHKCSAKYCGFELNVKPDMVKTAGKSALVCPRPGCGGVLVVKGKNKNLTPKQK
jgi:hypothetical protein